jgi:RNA polymerase sigma factor (TIGR02999 family)
VHPSSDAPGDGHTPETLLPLVYDELRTTAQERLRLERPDHTLRPTELVHEAFLKLQAQHGATFAGRTHFRAVAARAMRQILVDHARARAAAKRGGGWERVTISSVAALGEDRKEDVLAVEQALEALELHDRDEARIAELRLFGGLRNEEIASELGISVSWAEKQWAHARAWLQRTLEHT